MKFEEFLLKKTGTAPAAEKRDVAGEKLPFILRAWWMRHYQESEDLMFDFQMPLGQTRPPYCMFSDPLCDSGNMDFGP